MKVSGGMQRALELLRAAEQQVQGGAPRPSRELGAELNQLGATLTFEQQKVINTTMFQIGARDPARFAALGLEPPSTQAAAATAQVGRGFELGDPTGLNLKPVSSAEELRPISEQFFAGRAVRLATAGYSAAPPGYEETTTAFLGELAKEVGSGNLGLITSPTADKGSIDAISSIVGQRSGVPVLYTTAKEYVGYIKPEAFPEGFDQRAFRREAKYVFDNPVEYSKSTALASNALMVTGGRDASVGDFVNAIKAGNKVVLVVNTQIANDWDGKKGRPNNAAAYLADKLAGRSTAADLPGKGFDAAFLAEYGARLKELVQVVTVSGPGDVAAAAQASARHLRSP